MLAADTETGLIQGGMLAPPLACITWTRDVDAEPDIVHGRDPAARRIAEEILLEPHVGANWAYDLGVFGSTFPDLLPLVFESLDEDRSHDVLVAEKLFDIGDGCYRIREIDEGGEEPVFVSVRYRLGDLYERYFGESLEKDKWRLTYGMWRHRPLAEWDPGAIYYAKHDAKATLACYYAQRRFGRRVPTERYLANETFQCRASFALHLISCWGFKTDGPEVRRFLAQIAGEQEVRRELLQREGLVSEKESRTKKTAIAMMRESLGDRCVLTKKGLELYRTWWGAMVKAKITITDENKRAEKRRLFDQGYVSLAKDVCLQTGNELLVEYASYGQFQALFTKVGKLDTGGLPIQTSFETMLETGRTSSFASKLIPNSAATQNLPRKTGMRECFVPRNHDLRLPREKRKVLIACDFGMAELVSLSQICYVLFGYSKMREALNAGIDPHLDLAAMFLGITYAEAVARKYEKVVADMRQMAKAFSFGRPGGLGDANFILYAKAVWGVTFGATEAEALAVVKRMTRLYFKKWPEIRQYLDYIGSLTNNSPNGLCDIKQYLSNRLRGSLQYTVAANTLFQGLTADYFKQALWETQKRCYVGLRVPDAVEHTPLLHLAHPEPIYRLRDADYFQTHLHGARVVVPVHDEIVLECDEVVGHECAMELQHVMETTAQPWVRDVRITAEAVMMRRWRKGAKPTYHEGRLIPFEDRRIDMQEAA